MPMLHSWFSGAALFAAWSFAFSAVFGFLGVRDLLEKYHRWAIAAYLSALILFGLGWYEAAKQEDSLEQSNRVFAVLGRIPGEFDKMSDLLKVLPNLQQNAQAWKTASQILEQYQRQLSAISAFETNSGGFPDLADRASAAERATASLSILLRDVHINTSMRGGALYMQLSPNIFRVTFLVPMHRTPTLTLVNYGANRGVTYQTSEVSNVGFTVVFSPQDIPVESFGIIADSEL
jgi:hypothetical protein